MTHQPVISTTMRSVGYDEDRHLLEIWFQTGKLYKYKKVPADIFISLMQAESKGKYFNDHIRDIFPFQEIL